MVDKEMNREVDKVDKKVDKEWHEDMDNVD